MGGSEGDTDSSNGLRCLHQRTNWEGLRGGNGQEDATETSVVPWETPNPTENTTKTRGDT